MRFLSLCSGIEAASVAWAPMGWKAAAVAEIEAFPSAVLAHHYPDVPNLGDITKFKEWPDFGPIDIVCGGTPCQSFSIAGLRKGLADPRGNLSLTFLAIVDKYRPRYVVWENVPGVLSSDGGRDFASFLGGLGQLGYGWAFRVLDAQHVRVDGFPRAVPQRRRRVFVVGYLGDWRRAAAVLSEPESVLGNSPPRREARERVADGAQLGFGGGRRSGPVDVAARLAAHGVRMDFEVETFVANALRAQAQHSHRLDSDNVIVAPISHEVAETLTSNGDAHSGFPEAAGLVAHSLRAEGFDASEDGAGRGTPLVPVVWSVTQDSTPVSGEKFSPALKVGTGFDMGQPPAIAFAQNSRDEVRLQDGDGGIVGALAAEPGMKQTTYVQQGWAVRRLTPTECERLQGFPDSYTAVPYRGKPAADGPRYKALGNSWAVNVARWVGRRIEMVEAIAAEEFAEAAE